MQPCVHRSVRMPVENSFSLHSGLWSRGPIESSAYEPSWFGLGQYPAPLLCCLCARHCRESRAGGYTVLAAAASAILVSGRNPNTWTPTHILCGMKDLDDRFNRAFIQSDEDGPSDCYWRMNRAPSICELQRRKLSQRSSRRDSVRWSRGSDRSRSSLGSSGD
jgi:hypothetical protein